MPIRDSSLRARRDAVRAFAILVTCLAGCLCVQTPAFGRDASDRRAAALALFEEGRRLAAAEDHKAACLKFEAAAKLVHSAGILLNLGDCYEQTDRSASAWAVFRDAAGAATRAGRDLEEAEARRRQETLAPRLPRLRIDVPTAHRVRGVRVRRDGRIVTEGAWGAELPIDPGSHVIEVSAPGRRPWRTVVRCAERVVESIEVPLLEAQPAEPPARPAAARGEPADSAARPEARRAVTYRLVGGILAGTGLATLGAAGYLGFSAKSQYEDSEDQCQRANVCDSSSARRLGNAATVATAVGAAAVVAGTVIWFTLGSPSSERSGRLRIGSRATVNGSGVALGGTF